MTWLDEVAADLERFLTENEITWVHSAGGPTSPNGQNPSAGGPIVPNGQHPSAGGPTSLNGQQEPDAPGSHIAERSNSQEAP